MFTTRMSLTESALQPLTHDDALDESFEYDAAFEFDAPKWVDISADDPDLPKYVVCLRVGVLIAHFPIACS